MYAFQCCQQRAITCWNLIPGSSESMLLHINTNWLCVNTQTSRVGILGRFILGRMFRETKLACLVTMFVPGTCLENAENIKQHDLKPIETVHTEEHDLARVQLGHTWQPLYRNLSNKARYHTGYTLSVRTYRDSILTQRAGIHVHWVACFSTGLYMYLLKDRQNTSTPSSPRWL